MRKSLKFFKDERGSVESTLVLIPLLILFLLGFQLSTTVHSRNSMRADVQSAATAKAISGDFEVGDEFIHIDTSGDGQNLDLLVTQQRMKLDDLLPGFLGGHTSQREVYLHGLAIVENQR